MDLRDYVIAGIGLSIVILGVSLFQYNWTVGAGTNVTNVTSFVPTADLMQQVEDVEASITGSQITGTLLDIPITLVSGLYSIIKLMGTALGNVWLTITEGVATYWMIPTHYVVLIQGIIITGIIFTILAVLFGRGKNEGI